MLAARKWSAGSGNLTRHECLLTADTVVILGNRILNKPADEVEAVEMLTELSGNTHIVITGVCIGGPDSAPFKLHVRSAVTFHTLNPAEIHEYVRTFRPLDKAGAYGAQECLAQGANPCSELERAFIQRLSLGDILTRSKPANWKAAPMTAIKGIEGPYFNVMGLPVAELRRLAIRCKAEDWKNVSLKIEYLGRELAYSDLASSDWASGSLEPSRLFLSFRPVQKEDGKNRCRR